MKEQQNKQQRYLVCINEPKTKERLDQLRFDLLIMGDRSPVPIGDIDIGEPIYDAGCIPVTCLPETTEIIYSLVDGIESIDLDSTSTDDV
jgi:hypothetical protein